MSASEDDLRRGFLPRLSVLRVGITLAAVELFAAALLFLEFGTGRSFAVAFGAGLVFLSWPFLVVVARSTHRAARSLSRALAARLLDKRTYRFRLSTLLVAVLVIAIPLGWYGQKLREIEAERERLDGTWQLIGAYGTKTLWRSEPIIQEFTPDNYTVDPTHEPKRIDYHGPNGTNHGIYRWVGRKRIRVMTVSVGVERPTSFDDRRIRFKSGVAPMPIVSRSDLLWERVRD